MKVLPTVLAAATAGAVGLGALPALAYIGPGAGLSLLGALWGVLAAVLAAMAFLLFWPLRRYLRRQKSLRTEPRQSQSDEATQVPGAGQQRRR